MLTEWHLAPGYIINNWSDELLNLMIEKLVERKKRETAFSTPSAGDSGGNRVPADALFAMAGSNLIKVVKK